MEYVTKEDIRRIRDFYLGFFKCAGAPESEIQKAESHDITDLWLQVNQDHHQDLTQSPSTPRRT